ncbi:hypothetical protein V866_005677 [Kwoniella sp. B9012]
MGLSDTNVSGSVHSRDFATPQPVSDDHVSTVDDKPAEPIRSSDGYIIIDRPRQSPSQDSFGSTADTVFDAHPDIAEAEDELELKRVQAYLAKEAEIAHLRMMTSEIRGKNTVSEYTEECDYNDTAFECLSGVRDGT